MTRLSELIEIPQETETLVENPKHFRLEDAMNFSEHKVLISEETRKKKNAVFRFAEGFERGVAQAPQFLGESFFYFGNFIRNNQKTIFGTDPVFSTTKLGDRIVNAGRRIMEKNKTAFEKKFPDQEKDFIRDLGEGATSLAASIGIGMTLGPGAAGVAFGLGAKFGGFAEAVEKGKTFEEANEISSMLGFAEGGLEFVGINKLLRTSGGLLKRAAASYITEALQEFSQTTAEGTIKTATGLREFEGNESIKEIFGDALYAGAIGGVLGSAASVPIAIHQRRALEKGFRDLGADKNTAKRLADEAMQKSMDDVMSTVEEIEKESKPKVATDEFGQPLEINPAKAEQRFKLPEELSQEDLANIDLIKKTGTTQPISQEIPDQFLEDLQESNPGKIPIVREVFKEIDPVKVTSLIENDSDYSDAIDRIRVDEKGKPLSKEFEEINYIQWRQGKKLPNYWDQYLKSLKIDNFKSQDNPEALIMIGPPGSGKSQIIKRMGLNKTHLEIDPDQAKSFIPEYQEDGSLAGFVHGESVWMSEHLAQYDAMSKKKNIVISKVGKGLSTVDDMINELKEFGYSITLVHNNLPPIESAKRAFKRFFEDGRLVPKDYIIKNVGLKTKEVYDTLKSKADKFQENNVNVAFGENPVIVEQGEISGEEERAGTRRGRDIRQDLAEGQESPGQVVEGTQKTAEEVTPSIENIQELINQFSKFADPNLQKEIEEFVERGQALEVAEISLQTTKEMNDFLRGRINKSKNPDIAEEVARIPREFATTDPGGLSVDEALNEINNAGIGVQFENLSDMIDFLESSIEQERFLKQAVKDLKPKLVKRKDTTVLKQKIDSIKRGFRTGKIQSRREVKFVQDQLIALLNDSDLSLKDKAKFNKSIKNTQTIEQLNKIIPNIESRIDSLSRSSRATILKNKIKKELVATKVTKQAGKPVGKFGADIQNILDRMREISKMKKDESQELLQKNLESIGSKIPTFEQALENRLLSMMGGLENKNPKELETILNDILTLKSAGIAKSFLKDLDNRQRQSGMINTSLEVIIGDKPLPEERFEKFRTKAKKTIETSYISVVGWIDKLDILSQDDRASKQDQSKMNEMLRVSDEVTNEKLGIRTQVEKVIGFAKEAFKVTSEKELFRKLNNDSKPLNLGNFIDAFGDRVTLEFTKSELRKRWMELQDPSLLETFTLAEVNQEGKKAGMGYTQEMIDAINISLTQEDIAFAKLQLDFYREFYTSVNEVYREVYGVDLPFNEFYSPISRKFTQGEVSDEFLNEISFRRSVATGSLKSRIQNVRPIKEQSDIDILLKHIAEMEHFKNWVFKMRDLNAVFGNGEIRDAINKKFGNRMLKSIDNHLQDFTRGGINRANNVKFIENLRKNFTKAALSIKPSLTVKQMVSFVAYAETIPIKEFALGVTDFLSDPVGKTKILMESELLKARSRDLSRDIRDVSMSESFGLLRKNPTFLNSLMLNVRLGDKGAILLGGWSIYKYSRKIGKTHEEALTEFERVTANTQQSGDIDQLSDWQRGGSFQKLFTMFTSAQNQYFRREISAIRNVTKGRITKKAFLKKLAIYHFILPMFFQWIVDFGRWNEENQIRAALLGSLNGLFWLNDILENAINISQGQRVFPSQTPLQTLEKGVMQAIKEVSNQDFAEAIADLSKETVGPLTGIPIKTLSNQLEGLSDIEQGELESGLLKLMGWSPFVIEQNLN